MSKPGLFGGWLGPHDQHQVAGPGFRSHEGRKVRPLTDHPSTLDDLMSILVTGTNGGQCEL